MIKIKRVYNPPTNEDGFRILIDRLWPRGMTKQKAKVDLWLKEVAPSDELRRWFAHDPKRWQEFKSKYRAELKNKQELLAKIKQMEKRERLLSFTRPRKQNTTMRLLWRLFLKN